jgi:hypothetical protein
MLRAFAVAIAPITARAAVDLVRHQAAAFGR